MEELFTNNNLIRFVYNEVNVQEKMAFERELSNDFQLRAEYEMLKEAKQALPKALFNPSNSVLDRILSYSRETAPELYS